LLKLVLFLILNKYKPQSDVWRHSMEKILQANYRGDDKFLPDQEGNKLQRQKILIFRYHIY